ncbi:LLM class flavin-dependent oxidoreductase [Arthrobacter sp. NPDC056727]|uniref:LLM class flavin-dependent oxidoreductase n=1 Tax=Arthrobacter sp. NPDC056727 TaxID=3345927 RepID=UPI00366C1344
MSEAVADRKQAVLNLFTSVFHRGSWREQGVDPEQWINPDLYKFYATEAERGKLHALFVADTWSLTYAEGKDEVLEKSAWLFRPEPFTLAAALSQVTERVGLIVSGNTTFVPPYLMARQLAMLDHLSNGRAGWNIVTGHLGTEPANFGQSGMLQHELRYEKAEEYFNVLTGLWDSFESDSFLRDQQSGQFLDVTKMHRLNHEGQFFSVAGPLNSPRTPQGYPVFAQAGVSADGKSFAARHAEIMFIALKDLESSRVLYREMKQKAVEAGRDPEHLKILPWLELVVEDTDEEAQAKLAELNGLVDPAVALDLLEQTLYFDLSGYPLDGPLPEIPVNKDRHQSRQQAAVDLARRENLTIRELAMRWSSGDSGAFAGSPATIADFIEEWVTTEGSDGFNLSFANPWRSLPKFIDQVVPELQRRGVFRTEFTGRTLRENLGLPIPQNSNTALVAK